MRETPRAEPTLVSVFHRKTKRCSRNTWRKRRQHSAVKPVRQARLSLRGGERTRSRVPNPKEILRKKEGNEGQTYLFTSSPEPFDHFAIQSQWEGCFGSRIRARGRVSRAVWSHGVCVLAVFFAVSFDARFTDRRRPSDEGRRLER
jgi:hypothetical protein